MTARTGDGGELGGHGELRRAGGLPDGPVRVFFDGLASAPRLDRPEGVAVAPDGAVWCGGENGQIYRIAEGTIEQVATTGGFCLGLAFDADGMLFVCDLHHKAIFRLDTRTGALERFADGAGGHRFLTPNAIAIDARGDLLVSDSGTPHEPRAGLVRLRPDGSGELWSDEPLSFANGLALSADGRTLYVVETWARRVLAFPIDQGGACAGASRPAIELPGTVPDGVAVDDCGALWIACYEPSQVLVVEDGGVRVAARDPDAHLLCHPTNVAFLGTTLVAANLGRWHLTAIETERRGIPVPPSLG
jgi:sugar lactone lactonase YvrE